jgi:hypothetical protein
MWRGGREARHLLVVERRDVGDWHGRVRRNTNFRELRVEKIGGADYYGRGQEGNTN